MTEPNTNTTFAVRISNDGSPDLTIGMLYRILRDETAWAENLLRIVDDSGEDYLYPASRFVVLAVPDADMPRLLAAASVNVA
jgi:hypothetical protein